MALNVEVAKPANPSATASTTLVMMGLGIEFRPQTSGIVAVMISGAAFTNTAAVNFTLGGRYGTGTPPANGAAVTGSVFAADLTLRAGVLGVGTGFTLTDVVSLVPQTPYWFDLALLTATAADTAAVQNVSAWLLEV